MKLISLNNAEKNTHYLVKDIQKSNSYLYRSLINIGFFSGKKIYIKDVKYGGTLTLVVINDIEYAIRSQDLIHVKAEAI